MSGIPARDAHGLRWSVLAGFLLMLSLGFLGVRGLWEPDEGRYVEVAHEMLASGDYMTPTINGVPHFTKPPLAYWMVAVGLALLGQNEWGARLFNALAFAVTALLVSRLGELRSGSARGRWAGVVYATMILPFLAGSLVTADTLLVLGETSALYAFWRGWTEDTARSAQRWMVGFWAGLGVAFMAKGPPALLALLVVVLFSALVSRSRPAISRTPWLTTAGLATFFALTIPWFLAVTATHPGLADYFIRDEVLGRLTTGVHHRNSRWYMGLWIYPVTIALGALPWSLTWPRLVWSAWQRPERGGFSVDPARAFLVIWIAVPLLILIGVPSRLPLYVLPIFPALALMTISGETPIRGPLFRRARLVALVAVWGAGLVALRLLTAWQPVSLDARALAGWISPHLNPGPTEVVVVDRRIYGLPFYLETPLEFVVRRPARILEFQPTAEPWEEELSELRHVRYRHVFVVPRRLFPDFARRAATESVPCREESGYRDLRLLVCEPSAFPAAAVER